MTDCDQAKWSLWKVDDMFLTIESDFKKGFFVYVKRDKTVSLSGIKEKMTGIKTSFLTGQMVTLERTAGEHPGEGIGQEDYGDVVLHYKDRGGKVQEAYICDYEWGLEDASSICRHLNYEAGIPTYDGRYSSTRNPEYAVSGVHCEQEFKDCKFRTICGNSDPNCLVQQSMKPFKGKGYACNKNSKTDVAGVICGTQTTITKLLEDSIKCKRGSIEKDTKSVAQMYNLQKQVSAIGSKMFENKHWSEYLLPMPMAISLMSTLLLVSSQFERDVELTKPSSGKWDHLKYDWLQPNLLFLSNNVKSNFELSNSNMGVIKVNSQKVHTNMKLAVVYAFSKDTFDSRTLLPRHLRYIEEDAALSTKKAEEVSYAFKNTGNIIEELLEALKNSESSHESEKADLELVLKVVKEENKKDKETLIVQEEKKKAYDTKVENSRKAFFEAADEAFKTKCVKGTFECKQCKYEKSVKTGKCRIPKEKVCTKYKDNCTKYKIICLEKEVYCAKEEEYCTRKGIMWGCREHGTKCASKETRCIKEQAVCDAYDKNRRCIQHATVCNDDDYTLEGNYCQDEGNRGICGECTWLTEVSKTLKSVTHVQMQLQMDAMGGQGSYDGLTSVINDTVGVTNVFQQDLEKYNKWKQNKNAGLNLSDMKLSEVTHTLTETISTTTSSAPTTTTSKSSATMLDTSTSTSSATRTTKITTTGITKSDTEAKSQEEDANKNIRIQIQLMQKQLVMEIDLLQEIKLPIAVKASDWMNKLKLLFDEFISRKVQLIQEISEEEKIKFATLNTQGKALLQEAEKLRYEKEVSFKPGSSADHKLGYEAEKHTENLIARRKTEKNIETLTTKMRNSLLEIMKSEIKGQDLRATIEYLGKCFKHLNFLQLQWDSIKMFFQKLVDFLKDMKTDINRMKDFYEDIGMLTLDQPLSKSFKERLQTKIVEGLANNIYVMRIAFFYTKLAEEGLLDRMSVIGSNLKRFESKNDLNRYKKYIEEDALTTQEKIKNEISKEEAKINDRITNEVSSIRNTLACQLEDRKSHHLETKLTLEAMKNIGKILSSENDELNVKVTLQEAVPEDLETMNLFEGSRLGLESLTKEENIDDFMDW